MTLNELNFKKLITLDIKDVNRYSFDDYHKNNDSHPNVIDYCTKCEDASIKQEFQVCHDNSFFLKNISHGSKSDDFIQALDINYTKDWNEKGVMFIMENPSKDYGIYYTPSIINTYNKRPAKLWYWIHNKKTIKGYPEHFVGGEYGDLVASVIVTFKLKNAYLTNLVKCGLNNSKDEYKGIKELNNNCIEICINEFLKEEIKIIKPNVVFAFGSTVFGILNAKKNNLFNNDVELVCLPHPAAGRRGFRNSFFDVLYFCKIAKWLYKKDVIDKNSYLECMEKFAKSNHSW